MEKKFRFSEELIGLCEVHLPPRCGPLVALCSRWDGGLSECPVCLDAWCVDSMWFV